MIRIPASHFKYISFRYPKSGHAACKVVPEFVHAEMFDPQIFLQFGHMERYAVRKAFINISLGTDFINCFGGNNYITSERQKYTAHGRKEF